jgi:NAD(P)-dependent dehydrogenase (short-subunit alcohol dehydrogenase family)
MDGSPFDLSGRVALVTGGARGLGLAIARGLARQGASIVLVDRDEAGARATAEVLCEEGRTAVGLGCDVGEAAQVERTVAEVLRATGQIDVLVNSAGITKRIALDDWTAGDWDEVIRVNQVGTFLVAREVGRHMVARRSGSVVNVAALGGGLVGLGRGNAIYCGTKGAVVAMTRDLAAEWAPAGVRVNAVAPGWFRTEMNRPLMENPALLGRIRERVPLGRMGEPDEVVGAVVFLASPAASYVTGIVVPVDGGVSGIVRLGEATAGA